MLTKKYTVGNVYPELKTGTDVVKVDMDDSGLVAYIGFTRPTAKEIRNLNGNEPIKIGLARIDDVAFFLFRFGTLHWMDAPFNVNLARQLTAIPDIPDGTGISMVVCFFDSFSGKMISIRGVSLPTDFSRRLVDIMKETKNDSFDKTDYNRRVLVIQNMYSTNSLVKRSICKASFG